MSPGPSYADPQPGEVRQAGTAFVHGSRGKTYPVPSCRNCAAVMHVSWVAEFFEGECRGCGVALSGLVD